MRIREFILATLSALTALVVVSPGIVSLFQPGFPPSWGGDAYGHLFKVWKLYHYGWKPWIEDWYSGFPFLRFYPPLAYLVAWGLSILSSDPVAGYKLLVALTFPLSAVLMYLALRYLGFSRLASYLSSIAYSTSPWILRVVSPEGAFPRVFGFAMAPLALIALYMLIRGRRVHEAMLAGLFFSLLFLTHHTLAVTVSAISLILVFSTIINQAGFSGLKVSHGDTWRRLIANFTLFLVSVLLVSGFWLIPFITDRGLASFTSETGEDYLFRMQSVKPLGLVEAGDSWGYFQGYLRFSAPLFLVAVALLKRSKPLLISSIITASVYLVIVLLSLGAYGPAPWLNRLPVIEYIPPYRWLDSLQVIYAYALAVALDNVLPDIPARGQRKLLVAAISILLVIAAGAESYSRLAYWRAESFDRDLAASLNFIGSDNTTGWRFYQWGLGISKGSMVGFSPAIAGKPSLDGWYRQGDPLYILHGELEWALRNDAAYAESLLKLFGVKYVLVDDAVPGSDIARQILSSIGFTEVFRSGGISVYAGNNSILQAVQGRILVVSCSPDVARYVFPEAEAGRSCYLDDYTQRDLLGYNTVVLYDYRYSDSKSWNIFLDYVAQGGVLVVDTYRSPDAMRDVPGTEIKSEISRYLGSISIVLEDGSRVELNLTYEGDPWVSTVYKCVNCTLIASTSDTVIIASTHYGQGKIYVVGLNLFYYTYYTGDPLLRDYLRDLLAPRAGYAEAVLEAWSDGYMRIKCRSDTSFTLHVAEAWFPYWHAYIDSKPIQVYRSSQGLIVLSIPPGEHMVELVFEDPFTYLRYISTATAIAITALSIYAWLTGEAFKLVRLRHGDAD